MNVNFSGINWDTDDLSQCLKAYKMLKRKGYSYAVLSELNFGNLNLLVAEEGHGIVIEEAAE